jgi:hypothetical protein
VLVLVLCQWDGDGISIKCCCGGSKIGAEWVAGHPSMGLFVSSSLNMDRVSIYPGAIDVTEMNWLMEAAESIV